MTLQHVNLRRREHECCVFVGSSQYIRIGDVAPLQFDRLDTWSLVAYFRTTSAGFECFMSKGAQFGGPDLGRGWEFSVLAGRLHTRIDSDDVTNGITVESNAATFADGTWRHAVLTYAGTSLAAGVTMYMNGAATAMNILSDTLVSTIVTTYPFDIAQQNGTGFFTGHLDEIAVYGVVLSAADVTALYNGGVVEDYRTLIATQPIGYWRMAEDSTFPTIPDISVNANHGTMTNMVHTGPSRSRVPRPA